jgi:hypothetical protein
MDYKRKRLVRRKEWGLALCGLALYVAAVHNKGDIFMPAIFGKGPAFVL